MKDPRAGKPVALFVGSDAIFQRLTTQETLNRWKTFTFVYTLRRLDAYAEVVKPLLDQDLPRLWIRIGARRGDGWFWGEWDDHMVYTAALHPTGGSVDQGGTLLTLVTCDLLYQLTRIVRARAWRGRFQNIVTALVTESGFTRFAVEPTGPTEVSYIQAYEDNFAFLRRIQPAVQNERGESQYLIYATAGMLHFHTPGWQVSEVKDLVYNDQTLNDAADVRMHYDRHAEEAELGRGVTLVPFNPLTGQTKVYRSEARREMRFSDELAEFAPGLENIVTGYVDQNQSRDLEARAQYAYKDGRLNTFGLAFTITNYPFIGVGDIVKFTNRVAPAYDGLWLVARVAHVLDLAVLKTVVVLKRDSAHSTLTSVEQAASGNSDGRQLNLGELEASIVTQSVTGDQTEPDGAIVKRVIQGGG